MRFDKIKQVKDKDAETQLFFHCLVLGSEISVGMDQLYSQEMGCFYKKAILNLGSLQRDTFWGQK